MERSEELNKTWGVTCSTCKFCGSQGGPMKDLVLVCRRNPPHAENLVLPEGGGLTVKTITSWPVVNKADWCGEHHPVKN